MLVLLVHYSSAFIELVHLVTSNAWPLLAACTHHPRHYEMHLKFSAAVHLLSLCTVQLCTGAGTGAAFACAALHWCLLSLCSW